MFPGALDDISISGCKVRFPNMVDVDLDNDYSLNIRLGTFEGAPLRLICHPKWVKSLHGQTEVGFVFLHSPDTRRLESYIASKEMDADYDSSIYSMIIQNKPVFID